MALIRSHRSLIAAAATAALGVPAAAPAAHAATIVGLKPCYVSVDQQHRELLRGAFAVGFPRDARLTVRIGDETTDAVADSNGFLGLHQSSAPFQRRGQSPFTVTVFDRDDVANTASATSSVTDLSVRVRPAEAATSQRVRFRGRGFTAPRAIWGHYVLNGRVRRTVRFARLPTSECGTFSVRRRQFPMRHPRPGRWTLQVDQQRRWSEQPHSVYFRVTITVQRVVGT